MNDDQKNVEIFDAYQELKTLAGMASGMDLRQAKFLAYMKKDANWKIAMGDSEASWASFCAQPELQPLKVSKADRLAKIYKTYITDLGLTEDQIYGIDSNSLYRLASVIADKNENTLEWLDKARNLSRSDLIREIRFGDKDETTCEHDWKIKEIKTCKLCGAVQTRNI